MAETWSQQLASQDWDQQELEERTLEAQALGNEDPQVYVDFVHDAVETSERAGREKRYIWRECLKAHRAQIDYPDKADWQAKVVTGDMNSTVEQAAAIIKKAIRSPNWYDITGVGREDFQTAEFLKAAFGVLLDEQHARFDTVFPDATKLSFAIGQSHELIPQWIEGFGLVFTMVPPWQIFRDPDASPRDPWSGEWWDHLEWVPLWKVKQWGKENSSFVRLDEVTTSETGWGEETPERRAKRREQYWQRGSTHLARVIEHWGIVLDKAGNLLLQDCHLTVAGNVLIRNPEPNPFVTIRWPGVSFSPIQDLFTFEGHGVLETSLPIWLMTCNLMSMHADELSWQINRVRQLNRWRLEDPTDTQMYPGRLLMTKDDVRPGEKVLEEVYTPGNTSEILATCQDWRQIRQNNSFVTENVIGLPGSRAQITKGELELKASQGMVIFDSIGDDISSGAVNVLRAAREVLFLNWNKYSNPSPTRVLSDNPLAAVFENFPIEVRKELLRANCDIKISGISAAIKNSEMMTKVQWVLSKALDPNLSKYFRIYPLLSKAITIAGFPDPDFMVDKETAKKIDALTPENIVAAIEAAKAAQGGGLPPEVSGRAVSPGAPEVAPPAVTPVAPNGGAPVAPVIPVPGAVQ